MDDGAVVAIIAIIFGTLYGICKMIFRPSGSSPRGSKDESGTNDGNLAHRELFDLAMRLQNRVETLERLLDSSQPEWRGKP
jgi:phage shock protein B